ncbi:hypothetical protein LMG27952_04743 [Paraburkholderia hiiakae]|uniref:Glycosyltransferase RgtA/B/C/D-like domain-containing protein n=1 Tax=Paraburkholderia hiiakae TaxID=1081782 RepID=A0ABN7I5F9_9BURK|nr:hypothetical protein [Paraburkholderia hiiakae]CAD6548562.1 hypothetical protein LMG27952_04743 [Paraburkholderia hiiakae]
MSTENTSPSFVAAIMKPLGKKHDFAFLAFVALFSVYQQGRGKLFSPFWDYKVYAYALDQFKRGANPYIPHGFPFVYPPIFLNLFSRIPFHWLYLAFVVASLLYLACSVRHADFVVAGALGFLTGGAGVGGILTGNFAIFGHLLIIALFYAASQDASGSARSSEHASRPSHRATAKYCALVFFIALFASIKIYFLTYALVFFFISRGMRYFFAVPLCVALATIAQLALEPRLWTDFETLLRWQMLAQNDSGLVLFGILEQHVRALSTLDDVLFYEAVVVALFVYAVNPLRGRRLMVAENENVPGRLFYILAFCLALNPRMKEYDIAPFFACCYVSLFQSSKGDNRMDRVIFYAVPLAFIAAWIVAKFGHVYYALDVSWFIGVYFVFFVVSLRQRALRVSARTDVRHVDGDATAAG